MTADSSSATLNIVCDLRHRVQNNSWQRGRTGPRCAIAESSSMKPK